MGYDFQKKLPEKTFGRVPRGWHPCQVYQTAIKDTQTLDMRQHIRVDFEIISERELKNVLVPAFFGYTQDGKPHRKFLEMGKAAGLNEDYGDDILSVFRDLRGKKLACYVVHRYKNKQRLDRIIDFRPLDDPCDEEDEMQNDLNPEPEPKGQPHLCDSSSP